MAVPYDILAADDWISIVKPSRKAKICINGDVKKCAFRGWVGFAEPCDIFALKAEKEKYHEEDRLARLRAVLRCRAHRARHLLLRVRCTECVAVPSIRAISRTDSSLRQGKTRCFSQTG